MKYTKTGYFPEPPPEESHPQLLSVEHRGVLYKILVETFHLYERAVPVSNPQEHHHDVFHIVLYRAGDNLFKLDGRQLQSHPDTLVLIPPGTPHSFTPLLAREVIYHEITFSLFAHGQRLAISFADLFNKYYGTSLKPDKKLIALDTAAAVQLEKVYFELDRALANYDSAYSFPVYKTLGNMFELLFQRVFCQESESSTQQHIAAKLENARGHIERRLSGKLFLRELAVIAGMSPEHFCREFKKAYGEAPLEMRNRLRINAAMKLIQYSDRPIKQIAEELAYSDIYHFSKAFKKAVGISPGKFRNRK